MFKQLYNNLANMVLPKKCAVCMVAVDSGSLLCGQCHYKMAFISDPMCRSCGAPFSFKVEGILQCGACMAEPPEYEAARSLFLYDDESKKIITDFKYSDKTHMADDVAKMLARAGKEILETIDFITPVPMHRLRLIKRRYNQAALLGNSLAKITGNKILPDLLIRLKNTPPQASLSKQARKKNLAGAFAVKNKYIPLIKGKKIALVDDVVTTGTTINICSRTLKKAGASAVYALTIAKTIEN